MTSILYNLFWGKEEESSPIQEEITEEIPLNVSKEPFILHVDGTREPVYDVKDTGGIPFGTEGLCVQYNVEKFQPPEEYNSIASVQTGFDIYGPAIIYHQPQVEVEEPIQVVSIPKVPKRRRRSSRIAAKSKKSRKK